MNDVDSSQSSGVPSRTALPSAARPGLRNRRSSAKATTSSSAAATRLVAWSAATPPPVSRSTAAAGQLCPASAGRFQPSSRNCPVSARCSAIRRADQSSLCGMPQPPASAATPADAPAKAGATTHPRRPVTPGDAATAPAPWGESCATRVQDGRRRPDNTGVTSGVLAAPARTVTAPLHGGTAAAGLSRPLLLTALATAGMLATGLLPGADSVTAAVTLNFLAVLGAVVLLARSAPASSHPAGWRWYAVAVAVGALGALAAGAVLPWGQTALGSVPGQLLVVVAVGRMLDRSSLRAARAQVASMLALFVTADLLTVHTVYHLSLGTHGRLPLDESIALFALLFSIALGTGLSLVFISMASVSERPVGWTVFAAQVATALAGAFSSIATGPGRVQTLACAASVLGMGLLVVACRADRPGTRPAAGSPSEGSTLGALLPHCTALVGGSLLLLSVPITGRLTIFGTTLGVLGLVALLAHQAVSWRTQQQLTRDLQRNEAYFRTLVRGSADPVLILDDRLRVEWVSPAITELLGFDPARIIGLPIAAAVHPDDAAGLVAALDATDAGDETKTRTARVRHLDGRWRLIAARVRDLRSDPDVGALVLYCRDVTASAPQPAAPDLCLQHHRPHHRAAQPLLAHPAPGRHPARPRRAHPLAGRAGHRRPRRTATTPPSCASSPPGSAGCCAATTGWPAPAPASSPCSSTAASPRPRSSPRGWSPPSSPPPAAPRRRCGSPPPPGSPGCPTTSTPGRRCAGATWRCAAPAPPGRAACAGTPTRCASPRTARRRCAPTSPTPCTPTTCTWSTSRSSTSRCTARCRWRRCCAGGTRSTARSRPRSSSRWPRSPR